MARRRFQRGSLILRGTRQKKWVGKWREDVIEPSGRVRRIQRREVIGTKKNTQPGNWHNALSINGSRTSTP